MFRDAFLDLLKHHIERADVVELGCGQGIDSLYFAAAGCSVTGFDISDEAISMAAGNAAAMQLDVRFIRHDTAYSLPIQDASVDGVFSYLALHYFDASTTVKVVNDICRVLRPGGVLAFCVRSLDDPTFGRGELIEANMYSDDGHVRHFFSVADVRRLLSGWDIVQLEPRRIHYLAEGGPLGGVVDAVVMKPTQR
jgi:SAM-dependent methyltransferase